jgi:hypothetical protein
MTDISEAERLVLITRDQVRLVNSQAAALLETASSRDRSAAYRRAILDRDKGDEEAAAFSRHRAQQRQPLRLPHVCTVIPFQKR